MEALYLSIFRHENGQICFQREYTIRSTSINSQKRLGLYGLLGILQDAAAEHAFHLDFGYEQMEVRGIFWVIIRQTLKMTEWPEWHDKIRIETWTRPVRGIFAIREFEIFVDDRKIGACTPTWMILNGITRKPKELHGVDNTFTSRTDYGLDFRAEKINLPSKISLVKTHEVRIRDLDLNDHGNNIQYAQWVLDFIPYEYHKKFLVCDYSINFLSEAFPGNQIECYSCIEFEGNNQSNARACFPGRISGSDQNIFISRIVAAVSW